MSIISIKSMPKGMDDESESSVSRTCYSNEGVSVSIGNGCSCGSKLYHKTRLEFKIDIIPGIVCLSLLIWEGGDLYPKAKMIADVAEITVRLPLKARRAYERKVRRFAWDCFHQKSKEVDVEGVLQSIFNSGVYDGRKQKADEVKKVLEI